MSERTQNVSFAQRLVRFLLSAGILGIGIAVAAALVKTKPQAEKVERQNAGELVEVIEVHPSTQAVVVTASGTVVPAQQISVGPEVSGRVSWMSDKLIPGARFAQGEQLVRIDARDYQLAVEQQVAQVDRAQTELEIERGRKQIAEREWELLAGKQQNQAQAGSQPPATQATQETGSLALRDPQLRTAQAALKAANSGLDRAKLTVAKTSIRAPFNAMVQSKSVDMGQLVGPQMPLATLVGTDAFWVQVSIPVERLGWIQIPGVRGATEGSPARIVQQLGKDTSVRRGKVVRLLGDLDPQGRMARLLVEIEDPLGLKKANPKEKQADAAGPDMPLLLGSYVSVEISGEQLQDVVELPRAALHDGDQVYVMTPENTLAIKAIGVLWRRPDTVLVGSGLADGDKIVTSPIGAPVEGMKLRTKDVAAKSASIAPGAGPDDSTGAKHAEAPDDSTQQEATQGGGANAPALAKPSR